eukprot:1194531-Prorocentrum_minimum.AAC.5
MGAKYEEAAEQGNVEFFSSLSSDELSRIGAKTNEDGRTALHLAVAAGHPELVEFLLNAEVGKLVVNNADDEVGCL